ncbi:hypothetical protein BLA29_007326 [Euroglyphus maynei]|uniref:Uncharacterized protein n=1 Tax=Euroglyphus maynei TaxID=6958 RepID=A0A1Y3BG82_EURMA|nr:hypothetical protein BLA29_007326 [Euroglyphus maynei]
MQVYQKISNFNNKKYKLYQRDKYHGRRIKNEDGLRNELEIYFLNRTYLIRPIISRLKQLKSRIIETLPSCDYGFILGIDNLIRLLNEILFDAIRARVAMNQQRNNKRRRSSNGQNMDNYSQFPHMPSNKKWMNCNLNNNDDDDDDENNCDEHDTLIDNNPPMAAN